MIMLGRALLPPGCRSQTGMDPDVIPDGWARLSRRLIILISVFDAIV
jgi:hypothetical protein